MKRAGVKSSFFINIYFFC